MATSLFVSSDLVTNLFESGNFTFYRDTLMNQCTITVEKNVNLTSMVSNSQKSEVRTKTNTKKLPAEFIEIPCLVFIIESLWPTLLVHCLY